MYFFFPRDLVRPPKYPELCPSPRERPGNTKADYLLGHVIGSREGGDSLESCREGVGIIAAWFAPGIWIYRRAARRDLQRGTCFTARTAKLKEDDKTAID